MVKYSDYYIKTSKKERNNDFAYYFDKITTAIFPQSKHVQIKEPKKILIIRNDHFGDLILSTRVFSEIKKTFPESKITLLTDPKSKSIVEKNDKIDDIIEMGLFWRKKKIGAFFEYLKVLKKLKNEKFDVGIDIRGSLLNILFFLYLPRVKKRVAYFNKSGGKVFLTEPILFSKRESWRYTIMELVNKALNMNSKAFWPEIITDKEDEKIADDFLKKNNLNRFICLVPGTTTPTKEWPIKKYDDLIKMTNQKYPEHKILLLGGYADEDKINILKKENKNCVSIINFNWRVVYLILKRADVVISGDGAVKALAWIGHSNLIYLAGPVDLVLHPASFDKNTKVIMHKLSCSPCNWSEPCQRPCGLFCMEEITVDEVMKAVEEFLKDYD